MGMWMGAKVIRIGVDEDDDEANDEFLASDEGIQVTYMVGENEDEDHVGPNGDSDP